VITQHNRGTSEYPPRVRSELAPRYRRRDDGQRNRGIGTIRRVDHEIRHYPPRYDGETADVAGSIRPVTGRRIRGNWRPVSAPWSPRHIRDRLQGTIRPVVSQRIRGESESIRPVNAMRRRPLSGSEIGAASGKPTSAPWSRSVFWEVSAPKSGSEIGEPGESIIRPAIAVAKAPQCPQSVDAPLSPGKSRQIAESTIRPVTGVTGAPLPHHRPQFRSRSGRLHPHQATRGSTVAPGLDGEHRGELHPRAGRERDYTAANLASMAPLTGQLRPHQRSMANIGTVPLAFTWLITPGLRR
jgi:hypothetical protein